MTNIPTTPSLNIQLANAVAAVASAQDYLRRMEGLTGSARRNEADARNKVNEMQRHFDALVAEVRKSAPLETDWKLSSPAQCPMPARDFEPMGRTTSGAIGMP